VIMDNEKLCDIAAKRLQELRAAGCTVTDAEVVELNAIGWRRLSSRYRMALSRGYPVQCGNVTLWPLTIAAEDWMQRIGYKLDCPRYALAYAMANCYDKIAPFPESTNDAEIIVTRWAKKLRCHPDTLLEAIDQINQQSLDFDMPPPDPNELQDPLTKGDLVAWLSAYSGTPEMWEREVAASFARDWLRIKLSMLNTSGETMESAPEFRAAMQFGHLCEKIRRRNNE
jgi:hypothetical protein